MSFAHSVFQSSLLEFPFTTGGDMQCADARMHDFGRRSSARRSGIDRLQFGGVDFHIESNDVISSSERDFSIVANVEEKCYSFLVDNVDRLLSIFSSGTLPFWCTEESLIENILNGSSIVHASAVLHYEIRSIYLAKSFSNEMAWIFLFHRQRVRRDRIQRKGFSPLPSMPIHNESNFK